MFTTGQIVFAILFIIGFSIILALSYRKDKRMHQKNYKGVKWVGISFVVFIIVLFLLKVLLKN
ncbi:MAG: hypothetical protein KJO94_07630 [Eudoraea sp.]|nr:hypothetical protein [Eudoraea sp.]MBT8312091.1 hypothetical protein [Eudoraea sp.]MBT8323331.1 hypothetical protein [Eudoraea sp.]NNJ38499.1 hypothetical protein [Flavobacteriaceae bacterium]NNJ39696.1 hypothetical protein [Eudoraea sp.]